MRALPVALAAVLLLLAVGAGCSSVDEATPPPASTRSGEEANRLSRAESNERRLTRAESVRIVDWARTFRACMRSRGVQLGRIAIAETRIDMALPPGLPEADVLANTTACGERQGGPPEDVSLQYRPGRLVLYLPKQCLLDEKLVDS